MNKIITTHVEHRGRIIPVEELKEKSNTYVVVECEHGQRRLKWRKRYRLCRKCFAATRVKEKIPTVKKIKKEKPIQTIDFIDVDKKTIYMLCGQFGCGKTTVANKLLDKYTYIQMDKVKRNKVDDLIKSSCQIDKPILIDIPTMIITYYNKYKSHDFNVVPVFIVENIEVIKERILSRDGTITDSIEKRNRRILNLSKKIGTFSGTADEVFAYLNNL